MAKVVMVPGSPSVESRMSGAIMRPSAGEPRECFAPPDDVTGSAERALVVGLNSSVRNSSRVTAESMAGAPQSRRLREGDHDTERGAHS